MARPIRTGSRPIPAQRRAVVLKSQQGFALLIVLWVLVVIAFLTSHVTATGRTEIRIAGNLAANAAARAAADGAIYQTIFNLADPRQERRWELDRVPHQIEIGRSRVTVSLEDEDSRVNPSFASPELLQALLQVLGSDPGASSDLASAIAEWVGSSPQRRPPAALLAEYQAAGLDYGPPGTPLESLDELSRVRGMTPPVLAALRPHLTLFGQPVPDAAGADPEVAAALAMIRRTASPFPAISGAANAVTARIHAVANGPGNAMVARTAVARIGPSLPNGYSLLACENGED
jgi:general secretion pathway protein K